MIKNFFYNLGKNIFESFSGKNILWHFLAISITYILVVSGFDWFYFESTRNELLQKITLSAGIIGFLVPVLLPSSIYIYGKYRKSSKEIIVGLGMAQAVLTSYLISIFYKALTGRMQPDFIAHNSVVDISREFNFGFLENGIFWGWPSSHTAVAFAMSFALIIFYKKPTFVKPAAILYAFFIGIGASIGFHWFSDFVAGAIIGTLVGAVVGKNFLNSMGSTRVD